MTNLILTAFYFVLPAYFANMAPVFFARLGWLKFLARPIDAGRIISREFIFGENKTWRGLVAAVIMGVAISSIQKLLYQFDFFQQISLFDYSKYFLIFGFLAGLGAILGDLLKSFFKRRLKIKSGLSWPVFDQLDFVFGFLLAIYWLVRPSAAIIFIIIALTLFFHPVVNLSAYFLKIKKVWW